jgi:hypothetical protein
LGNPAFASLGRDWHHLLKLCGLVEVRVIDLEGFTPSKAARASISACRSRRSIWRSRSTPPRWHDVGAFVNMRQMTVSQMSITETTISPQHKLHWLAEQALS